MKNIRLNSLIPLSGPIFGGRQENTVTKPYPDDSFTKSKPVLQRGQLTNKDGTIFTRPVTSMFRLDLDWNRFAKYVNQRFKDYDRVNTYAYACSDGSEAYTISMLFQEKTENPEKFFPIKAKDINADVIKKNIENQKGARTTKLGDYIASKYVLGLNGEKAAKYIDTEFDKNDRERAFLTKKTVAPVEFSEANILEDIENIDRNNPSIVTCLNMWPYVDPKEYEEFANKLYDRLKSGSVVVIGEYDHKGEPDRKGSDKFPKALVKAGFTPADINANDCYKLVFEKN